MYRRVKKPKENKNRSVSNSRTQKKSGGKSTFQFVDTRPEADAQRKLHEIVNSRQKVSQLRAFQDMVKYSSQAKQAAQLQAMTDNYIMMAQKISSENSFGNTIQRKENNLLSSFLGSMNGISMTPTQFKEYSKENNDNPTNNTYFDPEQEHDKKVNSTQNSGIKAPIQRVIRIRKKKLKSRRDISQLWRADLVDNLLALSRSQRTNFRTELKILAEAKNMIQFANWEQAYNFLKEPKLIIKDGNQIVNIIRSTTDLIIWLGSHPMHSTFTPKHFSDTNILTKTLNILYGLNRYYVSEGTVWRKLIAVTKGGKPKKKKGGYPDWGEMESVPAIDLMGQEDVFDKVPGRYRRKLPEEIYSQKIQKLKSSLSGYKLVGVHATTMENTAPLLQEGVSIAKFNTGHGIGKGAGFYIIPSEIMTKRLILSARGWGSHILAVYLPNDAEKQWAGKLDNVQTMERKNTKKEKRYYMFGKEEAVIPPSLCHLVKLVVDPADISMGNSEYEAEQYSPDFSFLTFL
jgi:hypothetical protein